MQLKKAMRNRRATLQVLENRVLLSVSPGRPVLDLTAEVGVRSNVNNEVTLWEDQSARGNDLSGTGEARPVVGSASTPTGIGAVSFDGVGDRLIRSLSNGISGLPDGNQERTVFVVGQFHSSTAWSGFAYGKGAPAQAAGIVVTGGGNNDGLIAAQGWGAGNDVLSTSPGYAAPNGPTTGWSVLSFTHTASDAPNTELFRDGDLIASGNRTLSTNLSDNSLVNGQSASRIVIGQEIGESGHAEMDLAAAVVYDHALSAGERQAVEDYLNHTFIDNSGNAPPIAQNDQFVGTRTNPVTGNVFVDNGSGRDADPENQSLTVVEVDGLTQVGTTITLESGARLTLQANGQFVYETNGILSNTDSFTYTISDGAQLGFATVTISIDGVSGEVEFVDEQVVGGLDLPTALEVLPDGRIIVLEKSGRAQIFDPSDPVPNATQYLSLNNVLSNRERGFTDIAIDPDFENNGYIYIYYQTANPPRSRISRFTHTGNTAAAGSEFVVWQDNENIADRPNCCHFGGGLDFGPDGKLYLTTGDKWLDPNDSQDPQSYAGKILRLNTDGSIPSDNPFFGNDPEGFLDEIWAYGLRNPFRANWDLPTGRFFIGDVGGNVQSTAQEEINLGVAGANYGWPFVEGESNNQGFANPIFSYDHLAATPNGGAVAAGVVYRGVQYPSEFQGAYFFGDYVLGQIWYLKFDNNGDVIDANPSTPKVDPFEFSDSPIAPVAFEVGQDGALYYVDFFLGQVHRINMVQGNQPPVISSASGNPTQGEAPLRVNFTGSAFDPDGDALSYRWSFGDGNQASGRNVAHTYSSPGTYQATLIVSDSANSTVSDRIAITVGIPPSVSITSPADGSTFRAGDTIQLTANVSDDGPITGADYAWTMRFVHNAHTHPVFNDTPGETLTETIPTTGHDYSDSTAYEIELTVTDSDGNSSTDTVTVFPDKVDISFTTDFPGVLTYTLDGIPREGDFVHDTLIDFQHTVSVPTVASFDGTEYVFDGWSDGDTGASNTFTVPDGNLTLTARYVAGNEPGDSMPVLSFHADVGVQSDNGNVASWNDTSGSGNHVFAADTQRPTYGATTTPAGIPAVSFDGVNDRLLRETDLGLNGLPTGNQSRTVFLVAQFHDAKGFGGAAFGAGAPNEAFGIGANNSRRNDGRAVIQGWGAGNDLTGDGRLYNGKTGKTDGWKILTGVHTNDGDNPAENVFLYLDGEQIGSFNHEYATDTTDADLSRVVLGQEISEIGYIDMDVAAWVVYDTALSAADIQRVETELSNRYLEETGTGVPPAAVEDSGTTPESTALTLSVLLNDQLGAPPTKISAVGQGASGSVTTNGTTVTYVPVDGFVGNDNFTYTITDSTGQSSTAEVLVVVTALPNDSADLVLDLQATDGVDGQLVSLWTDLSGNGNHVSADGPDRPQYGSVQTPSGEAAISFDGIDDHLERTSGEGLSGLPTGNEDRTVFLVARFHDANAFGGAVWGEGAPNEAFGLGTQDSRTAEGRAFVQGWGTGNDFFGSELVYTPPAGPTTGWTILTAVHRGENLTENVLLYKDGALIGSFDHEYATDVSDPAARLVIGEEVAGFGNIQMDVAALQIYNDDLDLGEIRTIESQLAEKYLTPDGNGDGGVVDPGPGPGDSTTSLLAATGFSTWATGNSSAFAAIAGDVSFDFRVGTAPNPLAMMRGTFGSLVPVGTSSSLEFQFEVSEDQPLITFAVTDAGGNWYFHRERDIVAGESITASIPSSELSAVLDPSQLAGFDVLIFEPGTSGVMNLREVVVRGPVAAQAFSVQADPDLDGDGKISAADFELFTAGYQGDDSEAAALADLNFDGTVNLNDFMILSAAFRAEETAEAVDPDEISAAIDEFFALSLEDDEENETANLLS